MDKETMIFLILIAIVVVIFGQMLSTVKNEIVTGEVIDVELHDDYMTVTFDNREVYNVSYYGGGLGGMDITINSVMRIELHYMNPVFNPNVNDVWIIQNIVKVPVGDD